MGMIHLGPKHLINSKRLQFVPSSSSMELSPQEVITPETITEVVEVIKEVPVISYVDRVIEKPVDRIVEVIKHVPFEVRVIEEKIVEIIKHVEVPVEVKVIEEREKIVEKFINVTPSWLYGVIAIETLGLIIALAKLL